MKTLIIKRFKTLYFYLAFIVLILLPNSHYAQGGLLAEYYDGKDFNTFVTQEYVGNIENYWDQTPPVDGIDPHYCSIRWTGKLKPAKSATYLFAAIVDDGIRVWIDGEIIINQWQLNDFGVFNGEKELIANQEYDIKVEYFNALNEGEIKLQWAIKKSKEEESWKEYFFGQEPQYQIIHSDYFVREESPQPQVSASKITKKIIATPPQKATKKPKKKATTPPAKKKKPTNSPPPLEKKKVMTVERAKEFIPKNVEFVRSKDEILTSSYYELNVFAKFMIDNPEFNVTIEGHTDAVGDMALNQILSKDRAAKIAQYLKDKGIAQQRLTTVGYGGSRPLKVPKKGKYYPPNRRVVFNLSRS